MQEDRAAKEDKGWGFAQKLKTQESKHKVGTGAAEAKESSKEEEKNIKENLCRRKEKQI